MLFQVSGGDLGEWVLFSRNLLIPGVVAMVLWSPFLLSERIRQLFQRLPPTDSLLPTYVLVGIATSLPYVLGLVWALTRAESGKMIFTVAIGVTICYIVALPLVGVLGLPRSGIDWAPTGYGWQTWLLLVGGAVWYALLFTVPLTIFSLIFSLP